MLFKKARKIAKALEYLLDNYENISPAKKEDVEAESLTICDIIPEMKDVDHADVFEKIRPGDIVIAASANSLKMLTDIMPGHRTHPYIVAKKEKGFIRASYILYVND